MAEKTLADKLYLRPGYRALALNAPDGALARLEPLPEGVTVTAEPDDSYDFVLAFAHNKADIDRLVPVAVAALRPGGLLWFCYPKRGAGVETDINRDRGWETMDAAGYQGVAQVSVDATWSALRFRPAAEVGKRARPS